MRALRSASLIAAAALLAVAGCQSLGPNAELPPTVERAEAAARSGDPTLAAQIYESLAQSASGTDRNDFLMRAARAYLDAHRVDDAARLLAQASQPVNPAGAARMAQLRGRVAFAGNHVIEGVQAFLAAERALATPAERHDNHVQLLGELRYAYEHGVRVDPRSATDLTVRGWLELAPIAAEAARSPNTVTAAIAAWRARNARHPAQDVAGAELLGLSAANLATGIPGRGARIALLLPLTGRNAAVGTTVRDGFLTAYFQDAESGRPDVQIYDTEGGAAPAFVQAVQNGAQLIVGPLTRDEVTAIAALPGRAVPILALNFLPNDQAGLPGFYQFALSPEDEARQVARHALAEGNRRGVALAPINDWGTRVLAAFSSELEAGGGTLVGKATYDPAESDYAAPITQVLRISESRAREQRLESVLGTKLEFQPRRRADIDFIFAAAQSPTSRLLRPQLRFHFAGDLPTYATSDAYEPDATANQDMDGLSFPDMPWMLGGELSDSVRNALRQAWPTGGPRRSRLFAFGFDAYRLAGAVRAPNPAQSIISGLTGKLSLAPDGRVQRELVWAQLQNGQPRPIEPRADPR